MYPIRAYLNSNPPDIELIPENYLNEDFFLLLRSCCTVGAWKHIKALPQDKIRMVAKEPCYLEILEAAAHTTVIATYLMSYLKDKPVDSPSSGISSEKNGDDSCSGLNTAIHISSARSGLFSGGQYISSAFHSSDDNQPSTENTLST